MQIKAMKVTELNDLVKAWEEEFASVQQQVLQ